MSWLWKATPEARPDETQDHDDSGAGRCRRRWLQPDRIGPDWHEPGNRLRVFVSWPGWRRYPAFRICRPSLADRQYRLALRLHAAICRPAGAVDRVSRPWPDDRRRPLQQFR